jgi:ABC-type multidrug transport system fused ATPase/permease subunit
MYKIIEGTPKIPENDPNAFKPTSITGKIEFKGVKFTYPTRTNVPVLKGLDLIIEAGKKYALVGETRCSKSTVVQ